MSEIGKSNMELKPIEFNVSEDVMLKMEKEWLPLKLQGVNDKDGYTKIVQYRKEAKSLRVSIEKRRKQLKDNSIKYGKNVDANAKKLTERVSNVENHLQEQENIVKLEKERIKAEEQKQKEEAHQVQIELIVDAGAVFNGRDFVFGENVVTDNDIWLLDAETSPLLIEKIKLWKEKEEFRISEENRLKKLEQERQAKIAADQKAEQERLDKIAKEQAEQAAKLKEAQDKINKQNRDIEESKRVKEAEEKAKKEAEEKAEKDKIDADRLHKKQLKEAEEKRLIDVKNAQIKAKADIEAKEKAEKEAEEKAKKEADRKARLAPDKEKLFKYASDLLAMETPKLNQHESSVFFEPIHDQIVELLTSIINKTESK